MKQQTTLTRSRWLLVCLLSLLMTLGGSSPAWADPISITSTPYEYGFETDLAAAGWTVNNPSGSNTPGISDTKNTGDKGFRFSSYSSASTYYQYLISPEISATSGVKISFANKGYSNTETFKVGYSTTNTDIASFTWSETIAPSTSWTNFEYVCPSNTKYIAIFYNVTSSKYYLYIDDISLTATTVPSAFKVNNVGSTSANFGWIKNGTETAWQISYSTTLNFNPEDGDKVEADSNPFTLNGLTPNTTYYAYLRAITGVSEYSDWSNKVTFTTSYATPFSEDFTSSTSSLPANWGRYSGNMAQVIAGTANLESTSSGWSFTNSYALTGYHAKLNLYGTGCKYWLVSPNVELGTNYQLTFNAALTKNNSSNAAQTTGTDDKFAVLISTDDGAHWTQLALWNNSGSDLVLNNIVTAGEEVSLSLASYNNQTIKIAFYGESTTSNADNDLHIDDISITAIPACPKPTGLKVDSYTHDSATLSWTAGSNETEWKVIWGNAGFDPESNDPSVAHVIDNVTDNPYTLEGLSSVTGYDVYVKAVKGGDVSPISNKANFTTTQLAVDLTTGSFADDFEGTNNWVFVNGTQTNAWALGTATSNGGTKSMYISNDGGTTNAYTNNSETMVYATKLFTLAAGKYDISYDWKAYGESTYDYIRVAIVPAATALTAGTSVPSGFGPTALPSGWIAIDGGSKLNVSSSFANNAVEATITEAGNYMVMFAWRNDDSGGSNPPAAIDNFSIAFQACPKPTNVVYTGLAANEVTLNWDTVEETTWEVYISTESAKPAADLSPVTSEPTTNTYQFTGLTAETHYYAWVRAVKDAAKSDWVGVDFTTDVQYPAPTGLAISNLTTTSATLTWTAGSDTQWEVAYNTTGVTPTEAGTVVNNATYDFSELTTETTYYAFVRSKHNTEYSAWSAACEFTPSAYTYLTVNDGSTTNDAVPIYANGIWGSTKVASQFLILSTALTDMVNCEIKKMTFYSSSETNNFGNGSFEVYLAEVNNTSVSSTKDWAEMTKVYNEATLSVSGGKMTIAFDSSFEYKGGNLLVGIKQTVKDQNGTNINWYGVSTGNNMSRYVTGTENKKFSPKVTIGYQEKLGAELKVYDGETELTESPASFDFGFVPAGTTHTFTLKNTAATSYTAVVSSANLTVDPTTAITPDADGETFTVTMPNHDINNEAVVITPEDGKGLTAFTINVSGRYRDASKIFVDFTNDAIPTAWTASKWYRNAYSGYIYDDGTTAESHAELTTSRIVSTNENLSLSAKLKTDAGILNVWWSADGAEWLEGNKTELKAQLNTTEFTSVNVNVPAAAKYVKFEGYNAYIKSIYGLADAPLMKVRKTAEGANLSTPQTVDFGLTASADAETFYVVNASAGSLAGVDAILTGTGFTLNKTNLSDDGGNFTIAVDTEVKGYREATVTVSGTNQDDFVINLKGFVSGADGKMYVDFNDNQLPANWKNADTNLWEFADGKAHTKSSNTANALLTTCKLTVAADEVLAIKAMGDNSYSELKVHVYQNGEEITAKKMTFDSQIQENKDNYTTLYFTGLAAGDYKLVFEGWKVYIDEIAGFQVKAAAAHEAEVADAGLTIPTTGNQYVEYTASVNVEVTGTNDEQLTVKFFIGDTQYGESVVKDVTSGNTENFEVTFTPNAAVSGDAYFTIESDDIAAFESDKVAVTINAALVLDETVDPTSTLTSTGVMPSVVVKYNAKDGWNTICMPFALTSDILNSIFGTGWKAYEFKSYNAGVLGFTSTTTFYAGYPYIIYVETAASHPEGVTLFDVNIADVSANYDEHGDATFQGTYAPMAAGSLEGYYGVTTAGKIVKANASATMKGFRAYFTGLPTTATARLSFEDDATGIAEVERMRNGENETYYDLSGRKVAQPAKGLYIVSGKKVVVK